MALVQFALALLSLHWTHASTTDCRWAEYKVTFIKQEVQTPNWQQPIYKDFILNIWFRDVDKKLWDSGCQASCSLCLEKSCTTSCQVDNSLSWEVSSIPSSSASSSAPASESASSSAPISAGESWQSCLLSLLSCYCLPSHFTRNLPGVFNHLY